MSLDVRQAITAAREHFLQLLPEIVKSGEVKEGETRLEEIERDGDNWAVTLRVFLTAKLPATCTLSTSEASHRPALFNR